LALAAGLLGTVATTAIAQQTERAATPADRTVIEVTVYNGDLAMVRETRKASLARGRTRLALPGVSPAMQPATASVALHSDTTVTFIDQTFAFDLLTPESLLRHSVGQTVRVIRTNPATGEETVEVAKVLSARNGVILQIGDRIETGIPGRIAYDSLPNTLREKPTLFATFESSGDIDATLDLRYLTGGLTWQADYIGQLDKTGAVLTLEAVATVTNSSGAAYEDADLRLVAGTINQGPRPARPAMKAMESQRALAAAAPAPVPTAPVGDMHLYPIPRKTTLSDQETRQIILFRSSHVPVTKEYRVMGNGNFHTYRIGEPQTMNAERLLKFTNDKHAGLGIPMPAGTVRVYGATEIVSDTFLGADRIDHTADGEEVTLSLGRAFDITAERRQTDFKTQGLPKNTFESSQEIKIRNASDKPETVKLVDLMPGDWSILNESYPHKKIAANQAEWTVAVPPKGERTLTYTVRVQR
ncbi:MAG: DUF4139 domain-containing protein, partial [Gammaproteobacteria bacterium]